jgi:hypothetical protein
MKRNGLLQCCLGLLTAIASQVACAGPSYTLRGTITAITATPAGVMVMTSSGLPDNCSGTPYGWMIVPEGNKALVAMIMFAKATNKTVDIYTTTPFTAGYCTINQVQVFD